jgi:tetratricopeptide (TPR) repeat protein
MRGDGVIGGAFALGVMLVASTQLPVREISLTLKETSEAYLLPPADHLVLMSLGHRQALADLLWANVLVTQGIRMEQRRRFETVGAYLEAIIELDPQFREPYLLSDTLLTFQAVEVPLSEVYRARQVLERAVKERPDDAMLWLQLGQFMAFIAAPSYLKDPAEQERWRVEGARYLARAAELGVADPNIQWQALGGAGILSRAGERDAAIAFIARTLATDPKDEELRAKLEGQLAELQGEAKQEARRARVGAFRQVWQQNYSGRTLDFVHAAGFPADAALCAGGLRSEHAGEPACASDWAEWARRVDAANAPRDAQR